MNYFQVPVVMGPPKQSYERMAPPNSYIHIQDFPTAKDLAKLVFISGLIQKASKWSSTYISVGTCYTWIPIPKNT